MLEINFAAERIHVQQPAQRLVGRGRFAEGDAFAEKPLELG
jgi:hypothetical protein